MIVHVTRGLPASVAVVFGLLVAFAGVATVLTVLGVL